MRQTRRAPRAYGSVIRGNLRKWTVMGIEVPSNDQSSYRIKRCLPYRGPCGRRRVDARTRCAKNEHAMRIGNSNHPSGPSPAHPPPMRPDARNQPYVEPKLRGRAPCRENRASSMPLRGAPAVDRPPTPRAALPANRSHCPSLDPGQEDPCRLPHRPTESRFIVHFTAGSTAAAAPAPHAAARSGAAPPLRAPGARGSSQSAAAPRYWR
jgi:hypothetical protein